MKKQGLILSGILAMMGPSAFGSVFNCSDENAVSLFAMGSSSSITLTIDNGNISVANESGEIAVLNLMRDHNGYFFYESNSDGTPFYGVTKGKAGEGSGSFVLDFGDYRSEERQNHYFCLPESVD